MTDTGCSRPSRSGLTRRQFVQGLALGSGGLLLAEGWGIFSVAHAAPGETGLTMILVDLLLHATQQRGHPAPIRAILQLGEQTVGLIRAVAHDVVRRAAPEEDGEIDATAEDPATEVSVVIAGHDLLALGFKPGPVFREILDSLQAEQLEGRLVNSDQARDHVRRIWGHLAKNE